MPLRRISEAPPEPGAGAGGAARASESMVWMGIAGVTGLLVGSLLPVILAGVLQAIAIVIAVLVGITLFAMPRRMTFSDRAAWTTFLVVLVFYSCYPHYISIQLPGLPWISPIRIALAVMLILWLYALRNSLVMGANLRRYIRENRVFFLLFATYVAAQALSVPTSVDVAQALTKFLLFQLYWTFPFFCVLSLVDGEKRIAILVRFLIGFAAFQCAIGFFEARQERLIWLDYLPPGFGADSELLARIIQGTFRADGYRVQGSFSVSLVYAEFLVLMLPFALFAFMHGKTMLYRSAGLLTAIAILPAQFLSGSRLGMVGTLTIFLLLVPIYVVRKRKEDPRSMVGPLLILLLPVFFVAFSAAYVMSPRLQSMTIGGGQHQASTDGRLEQAIMAAPKIVTRMAFGHGVGLGAEALGFRNLAGILTIDSYVLSVLLEVGLVGFCAYFGMLIWAIIAGLKAYLRPGEGAHRVGGAIMLSLCAFLTVKLVLSQSDTHMLVFVMMALLLVVRRESALEAEPAVPPLPAGRQGVPRRYPAAAAISQLRTGKTRAAAPESLVLR